MDGFFFVLSFWAYTFQEFVSENLSGLLVREYKMINERINKTTQSLKHKRNPGKR